MTVNNGDVREMFPTHVGMNRLIYTEGGLGNHVPHTRGDEPFIVPPVSFCSLCSPHTWG